MSNFLRINELEIKNIRCYSQQKFSFTRGNNTLLGSNGSGKSTVLLSVGVGLFGSEYISSLNIKDLVNRSHQTGEIILHFETKRGKFRSKYTIGKSKNKFELYQLTESGKYKLLTSRNKETRERINEVIGTNLDVAMFKNAISSPQGELTKLIDQSASERQKAIRKILGLERFQNLEVHMKNIRRNIDARIDLLNVKLDGINERAEDPLELEKSLDATKKEYNAKKDELNSVYHTLKMLDKVIEEEKKKRITHQKLTSELDGEIKQLNVSKEGYNKLFPVVKKTCEELGISPSAKDITKYKDKLNEMYDSVLKDINGIVNDLEKKQNLIDKKKEKEKEILNDNKRLSHKKNELKQLLEDRTIEDLNLEIKTIQSEIKDIDLLLEKTKISYTDIITKLETNAKEIKELLDNTEKVASQFKKRFTRKIDEFEDLQKYFEDQKNQFDKEKDRLETKIDELKNLVTIISNQKGELLKVIDLLDQSEHTDKCPTCLQNLGNIDFNEVLIKHKEKKELLEKQYSEQSKKLEEMERKHRQFETKLSNITQDMLDLNQFNIRGYRQDINNLEEKKKKQKDLESEKKKIEARESEIRKEFNQKNLVLSELETKQRKSEFIVQELEQIKNEIQSSNKQIAEISKEIETIDDNKLSTELSGLKSHKEELKVQIKQAETLVLRIRDIERLSNEKVKKEESIKSLKSKLEKIILMSETDLLDKEKKKEVTIGRKGGLEAECKNLEEVTIPSIETKLKEAKEDRKKLLDLKEKLKIYNKAFKIYGVLEGIFQKLPQRLLMNISNSVSNVMTNRMQTLFPNRNISKVILDPDGTISLHQDGHKVDPKLLSGGERTALGLALRIALMKHVAPLEFMILDEPTNHLDTDRISEFISIIQENSLFNSSTGQLLLVTHREEFEKVANRVIKIDIGNGGERVVDIQ